MTSSWLISECWPDCLMTSVPVTIKRDATQPNVSLVGGPADGATYAPGSVPAAPTCSASDAMSGLAGPCSVSGYLTALGTHTATASAEDNAGNTNSASATYNVFYNFAGFFSPVDNSPTCNVVKAGQAIPIKFSLGGNQGLDIFAGGYPKASAGTCTGSALDGVEETVTAGQSSLSYDSTANQYIYVWKTEKSWAGKAILLTVRLADGTDHFARFSFTK